MLLKIGQIDTPANGVKRIEIDILLHIHTNLKHTKSQSLLDSRGSMFRKLLRSRPALVTSAKPPLVLLVTVPPEPFCYFEDYTAVDVVPAAAIGLSLLPTFAATLNVVAT